MNILTFDIEEWFLEKKNHSGRDFRYKEFDDYLAQVLDLLDEKSIKATFFCLGKVASGFPSNIRKIADKGYEIGCHSNTGYIIKTTVIGRILCLLFWNLFGIICVSSVTNNN